MARILFIVHKGSVGGPNKSLLMLLSYMRHVHETAVLLPAKGSFTDILEDQQIPYYVSPLRLRYVPALTGLIWRKRFDLVYGNNVSYPVAVGLMAARFARRPFIWHVREIMGNEAPGFARMIAFVMPHARQIVAVSHSAANHAVAAGFLRPEQKPAVIHNGIEWQAFAIERDEARQHIYDALGIKQPRAILINSGTLCERKNQLQLVEAMPLVTQAYPAVLCLLLGRVNQYPDYSQQVTERIKTLHLEDHVKVIGFRDDIDLFTRGADILVHTATRDPHPRTVLEAMVAGLPVVSNDVDGVSETVIHNETGYLLPINDVPAMAQAIVSLLENPTLRQSMGQRGHERIINEFTAEQTARQIEAVVQNVLNGKR